jgi:ribosomal protein S18 acetylase RimI-like enzyme
MTNDQQTDIIIADYTKEYGDSFRSLNVEWISTYFKMEEADFKALDNPEAYIIAKGGFIKVALFMDEPVGVCAMIKMNNGEHDYELAKMAVSPKVQGMGIGWLLGQAFINKAISLHAKKVYLESNTVLAPAINLYRKLGFTEIFGKPTPYQRSNIQMELIIDPKISK